MKIAADTSVLVASFASWHEHHGLAAAAIAKVNAVVAHCLLETFSVLTRLPAPHRMTAKVVSTFLDKSFSHHPVIALPATDQRVLVDRCRALVDGSVPAYVPVVRGGGKMHVRMLCLGRHWNGKTYTYETHRTDFDNLPAPPLPENLAQLARDIAKAAGMTLAPDLCII